MSQINKCEDCGKWEDDSLGYYYGMGFYCCFKCGEKENSPIDL